MKLTRLNLLVHAGQKSLLRDVLFCMGNHSIFLLGYLWRTHFVRHDFSETWQLRIFATLVWATLLSATLLSATLPSATLLSATLLSATHATLLSATLLSATLPSATLLSATLLSATHATLLSAALFSAILLSATLLWGYSIHSYSNLRNSTLSYTNSHLLIYSIPGLFFKNSCIESFPAKMLKT